MLIILSPTKNLDMSPFEGKADYTLPQYSVKANLLIKVLKKFTVKELERLMKLSSKLADINYHRYQMWNSKAEGVPLQAAVLAFSGEVFNGLQARSLSVDAMQFAQNHLRILSGMYGVLRPLDRIQAYRLEMGTKLEVNGHTNLYGYWGDIISDQLKKDLKQSGSDVLINLASNEYSKAAKLKRLGARVITPVFKELKGDQYKMITIYAKKARGLMTRFILENALIDPEQIKLFDSEGYFFNEPLSSEGEWVFTR